MEKYFRWGSLLVYLIAFALPVFKGDEMLGANAFILGVLVHTGPWLANVFYLIALFVNKKNIDARIGCGAVAITLGLLTLRIQKIEGIGSESEDTPVSVGIGFFFWMASFIVLLAGIFIGRYIDKPAPEQIMEDPLPPGTGNTSNNSGLGH
ncbi:MAG: hypothetical protein WDN26_17460 [Chitinophagaceae bacterium]